MTSIPSLPNKIDAMIAGQSFREWFESEDVQRGLFDRAIALAWQTYDGQGIAPEDLGYAIPLIKVNSPRSLMQDVDETGDEFIERMRGICAKEWTNLVLTARRNVGRMNVMRQAGMDDEQIRSSMCGEDSFTVGRDEDKPRGADWLRRSIAVVRSGADVA